jgi:hypothetical protein
LYTDWWSEKAFAWRERIQPGHSCRPRELLLAHLLWCTFRWVLKEKVLHGLRIGITEKLKRTKAGAKDGGVV